MQKALSVKCRLARLLAGRRVKHEVKYLVVRAFHHGHELPDLQVFHVGQTIPLLPVAPESL